MTSFAPHEKIDSLEAFEKDMGASLFARQQAKESEGWFGAKGRNFTVNKVDENGEKKEE